MCPRSCEIVKREDRTEMLSDSGRRVKRTFRRDETKNELAALLEGYLFGLGEVCHTLFGPRGVLAMYRAVGKYFLT